MDKKELFRTIKFTLISASAGIIQALSFTLCNELIGLEWSPSYVISLVLSVLWNFTLNRKYTFKSANNVPIAMVKVAIFYLIFTPASTWLGNYLTGTLGWNDYLVTGLNMVLNLILEYFYQKYIVFANSIDSAEK